MKMKQQNIPTLLVDIQEKSGIIKRIEELPEYFPSIEVQELGFHDPNTDEYIQCLDYTNTEGSFGVEHKIIHKWKKDSFTGRYKEGDFHQSLISGRLQDQVAKMRIYFNNNLHVMCEGFLLNYAIAHPKLRAKAYSFVGKCGRNGVSFTECYNQDDFLEKLYWINRESGKDRIKRADVRNEGRFVIPQISSLSRIPYVGVHRARLLLKKYGNIYNILLGMDHLIKIPGIGKKTQESIQDWYYDQVIINDEEEVINQ